MRKATKIGLTIIIIAGIGVSIWLISSYSPATNPLPLGDSPALNLPFNDVNYLDFIRGFGNVTPSFYHNGNDFGFNGTTVIVAPCAAIVTQVQFWYNENGGHWQTSLSLRLNQDWSLELYFESFASTQDEGQLQANAVTVKIGDAVTANQTLGQLLRQGSGSHVHLGVMHQNVAVCPYNYLMPAAKNIYDTQFSSLNSSVAPCM